MNHHDSKWYQDDYWREKKTVLRVIQTINRLLTKNKKQNGCLEDRIQITNMHYLYLATFDKKKAKNSVEARKYANDFLLKHYQLLQLEDEPAPRGYYLFYRGGLSLVDWWRIGGSWSGFLLDLQKTFWSQLRKEGLVITFADKVREQHPEEEIKDDEFAKKLVLRYSPNDIRYQKVWRKVGGKGKPSFTEWLPSLGQKHDAMLVTENLYQKFLKPYEGRSEHENDWRKADSPPNFADLDEETVSRSFIGNKWIVVVDCHS